MWSRTAMFSGDLGLPPALGPEIVRTAAQVSVNPGIIALHQNNQPKRFKVSTKALIMTDALTDQCESIMKTYMEIAVSGLRRKI